MKINLIREFLLKKLRLWIITESNKRPWATSIPSWATLFAQCSAYLTGLWAEVLQSCDWKPHFRTKTHRSEPTSGLCGFSEPCSRIHITGGLSHWSFVWRLRRHEEGLDWPYRNKAQSGGVGGGSHSSRRAEGVERWGQTGVTSNKPQCFGGADLSETGGMGGWCPFGLDNIE